MEENKILECLADQKEELNQYAPEDFVAREECNLIDLDSKLAQVVTGVRRSGKSTLCHLALRQKGENYGYVNFDDDRLAGMKVEDLNIVLTCLYRIYGPDVRYMFFDEIQNVDGWHLFVNRLLRQGHRLVITGSNAKLLGSELTTHLTGRYNEIKLFPFSFKEFCRQRKIDIEGMTTKAVALKKNALESFLSEGGFPELPEVRNRIGYVTGLVNTIINKDILKRYKLRNGEGLRTLANHLINNFAQLINVPELSGGLKIGTEATVRNYIEHLSQSYLVMPLSKFSYKSRERLRNKKAYVVDNGMVSYHDKALSSLNIGWRLENAVYIEILRRTAPKFQDVYYFRQNPRSPEVDFVIAERGKVVELIQVSYDVSSPKTFNRELSALANASKSTGCMNLTLITMNQSSIEEHDGRTIHVIPALDWFLEK